MSADADAIVVGAGHNGLVCALRLAAAGWRVLVLERGARIGGGLASAEVTRPGFRHDLYATNVGAFAALPLYRERRAEFEAAGLRLVVGERPFATAYDDGSAARMYRDDARAEAEFAAFGAADLAGWKALSALFRRRAAQFLPLQATALPSLAAWRRAAALAAASPADALALARLARQSALDFVDAHFASACAKGLFLPWAFHPDYAPEIPGGGIVAFIAACATQANGLAFAAGGAGRIATALGILLERAGAQLRTGCAVRRIVVRGGRAVAVETDAGETIGASRAIVANVTPRSLFGGLVAAEDLPAAFLRRIGRYRYAPGTFVVHLALSRALEWRAGEELSQFSYVHLNADGASISTAYAQSIAGAIPARPMLCVSQPSVDDPLRAPPGQQVVRIHARAFPARIGGDAAGRIAARDWDSAKPAVAERLLEQLAAHAPNLREVLLDAYAVSPADLKRENPNWVGGDCSSGSQHLDQHYFARPLLGWSRYATPLRNLYMTGAATWPGSGAHGLSGELLAARLLD
ncbi:MAG: hypothetical protein A3H32_15475 [Betaproteobacteria bacterium RIFCSPLOWO2_02_FULL_63_19]|nr:MAG: hypothetical protein A3H32_15475 [Betaproteobacteria bacterium RIFCSPLOWO2_02_FULL_63_19]